MLDQHTAVGDKTFNIPYVFPCDVLTPMRPMRKPGDDDDMDEDAKAAHEFVSEASRTQLKNGIDLEKGFHQSRLDIHAWTGTDED